MGQLLNVYGFLSVILRAASLFFLFFMIGGVLFSYLVLGRWRRTPPISTSPFVACERLLRIAGLGLAIVQIIYLTCESLILVDSSGMTLSDLAGANFLTAGIILVFSGVIFALYPYRNRYSGPVLLMIGGIALAAAVSTTHAFSRVNDRASLVTFTAFHLAAVACWIGSLPYLLASLSRTGNAAVEPTVVFRYSRMATLAVGILFVSGLATAAHYFDSFSAVYGTAYGVMLLAKCALFAVLLLLGASNRAIVKRANVSEINLRLRYFVVAELGIGVAVILTAASMTSQPPAVDLRLDRVQAMSVVRRFTPKWPRLKTPSHSELTPATRGLDKQNAAKLPATFVPGEPIHTPNTPADIAWSEYNHNWVGLLLLLIALAATIAQSGRFSISRHWPLLFLLMAVFIFLRADPENWPLGPNTFWESFDQVDVLQHRLAVLLVIAFAVFEWRVQLGKAKRAFAPLVFPSVCILGGMLLVTHTHRLNNFREEVLVEMSHLPIALLAILAGWSRWLQLKLPRTDQGWLKWVWPICFVGIAFLLGIYREA